MQCKGSEVEFLFPPGNRKRKHSVYLVYSPKDCFLRRTATGKQLPPLHHHVCNCICASVIKEFEPQITSYTTEQAFKELFQAHGYITSLQESKNHRYVYIDSTFQTSRHTRHLAMVNSASDCETAEI